MGSTRVSRFILVAVVVALVATTAPAWANEVNKDNIVTFTDAPGSLNGGEFVLTNTSLGNLAFRTFCVQTNEYLTLGTGTFKVDGVTGWVKYADPAKALNPKAAYLYSAFRAQTLLTSYDYTNASNQEDLDATGLQLAIWQFQGEAYPVAPNQTQLDKRDLFVGEANTANWTTLGNVRVANLLWETGLYSQGTRA